MPFDAGLEGWVSPEDLYSMRLKWTSCIDILHIFYLVLRRIPGDMCFYFHMADAEIEIQRNYFVQGHRDSETKLRFNPSQPPEPH